MTPEDIRPLLTPAEAAQRANVSRKTIYHEIDREPYPPVTPAASSASTSRVRPLPGTGAGRM